MVIDVLLIILGVCFLFVGLVGSIVPIIPGPPLGYIALLFMQMTSLGNFSVRFLLITAGITIVVTIVDYILPMWGTRKWGGSKAGVAGSMFGLLIGLFFLPIGIIIGPFAGAVVGELITGGDMKLAIRSGVGAFTGFVISTLMKLALSSVFVFHFFKAMISV